MPNDTLRQHDAVCTLTVDGRELPFVFQKRTGGKTDSEGGSKTYPGGSLPQRAHGGLPTVEDLTLEAEFVPNRDNEQIQWLKSRVTKGDAGVVENGLDVDGNVIGALNRWTGIVKSLDTGDYDASSADPRMFVVEVEAHGTPG